MFLERYICRLGEEDAARLVSSLNNEIEGGCDEERGRSSVLMSEMAQFLRIDGYSGDELLKGADTVLKRIEGLEKKPSNVDVIAPLIDEFLDNFNPITQDSDNIIEPKAMLLMIGIALSKDTKDDNQYFLQAFILEFLIKICSLSDYNCSKLGKLQGLSTLLIDYTRGVGFDKPVIDLLTLVSSVKLWPSDLLQLFSSGIDYESKRSPNSDQNPFTPLLNQLLDLQSYSHINLNNSSVSFTLVPKVDFNCYTLQVWLKFNSLDNQTLYSDDQGLELKLESMKLAVYYRNVLIGVFENFIFDTGDIYNIVLIHYVPQSSSSTSLASFSRRSEKGRLRLYVNSEFIQYIKCPFIMPLEDDYKTIEDFKPLKVTIGSERCEFDLYNFRFVDKVQPFEWILLSYNLGPSYQGDFSDRDLLKFLNYEQRTRFNLHLLESAPSDSVNMDQLKLTIATDNLLVNFNSDIVKTSLVLDEEFFKLLSLDDQKISVLGAVYVYFNKPTSECFYSIGSMELTFSLIENSKDMNALCNSLSLLFKLISSNWKLVSEMESLNGYNILSTILKLKKTELQTSLNIKILDLFLEFVGYNFQSPFNSVIMNHAAYDALILDFNLWKPITPEEEDSCMEIFKFLIFQLTVFSRECKYNSFNLLKLKKLKVVKKILNYMRQGYFPRNLEEVIHNSLLILTKSNLTAETIKGLSSFVVYALNDGNHFAGVLVLKVLAEVFLDPLISNLNFWKKLFSSISIKWILLLIQFGLKDKFIIDISLTMLIKIFVTVTKSYDFFLKNNGLMILFSALRDIQLDQVEIKILLGGSFGQYQYDLNFQNLCKSLVADSTLSDFLVLPELHYLVLDSLEWMVLNDIFQADSHEKIISLLDDYSDFLTKMADNTNQTSIFIKTDKIMIRKICNIILLLTKPQNASVYSNSAAKFTNFLSRITLSNLLQNDSTAFGNFLNNSLDDSNGKTIDLFIVLVFPKVLVHLKEFGSEFQMLFSNGVVDFNSLGMLLDWLNERLLVVEWILDDYFNYLSILLESLQALQALGKSNKSSQVVHCTKNIITAMNMLIFVLKDSEVIEKQDNLLRFLLFHQANLFSGSLLVIETLSNIVCLLVKISTRGELNVSTLSLNCLRIVLMHKQSDISSICSSITFRNHSSVLNFLESILSVNDEEIQAKLRSDSKLANVFIAHLDNFGTKMLKKVPNQKVCTAKNVMDSLYRTQDDLVKAKYENIENVVKLIQNDNELSRIRIVSSEMNKHIRFVSDQQDNIQYFVSQYNKLKLDTAKLLSINFTERHINTVWSLDHMEGIDRIRKRLISYDALDNDEKLSYTFEVPIKSLQKDIGNDTHMNNETLSLNSYELIESDFSEEANSSYNDKNRKVLKSLFAGDRICELWNISQVVGLEINEGILILGQSHIYIIQNYFHKTDPDEVIDINDAPAEERDPNVKLISGQPRAKSSSSKRTDLHSVQSWELYKMTSVTKRQFLLRDVALEIFFSNGSSFLITCIETKDRNAIYTKLSSVATNSDIDDDLSTIFKEINLEGTFSSRASKIASVFSSGEMNYLEATKKWQKGEMSNFYYLMIINTLAGRTFNDLTQYPVFPWVIADYTSDELDLDDPNSFRDLSKPMGAQSPQRAQQFKERYEALESLQDEDSPPFHYGTHYSSAMIVTSFLIRLEPFVQSYLLLQGGKFDHADRLFYSIEKAWSSASKDNTTDVRELIPEFYFLPEFLSNINGYEFGKLQDGKEISDVELPKWAHNDPKIFIAKNREALESPFVSQHLHEWIDLIFGYKQSGQEAVESINVFNHLSYHGAIDLSTISDEVERRSVTGIIHNFGQTPMQIFAKPHPKRDLISKLVLDTRGIKELPTLIYQSKFHSSIRNLQFSISGDGSSTSDAFWRGYPKTVISGEPEIRLASHTGSVLINNKIFEGAHDERIISIHRVNHELILTGSESGLIHVWRFFSYVKGLNERLIFETALRGHLSGIVEFCSSSEYNLLLSLDSKGNCFQWDLARFKFIRKIDVAADHCTIAYDSGMIATTNDKTIKVFSINGELILQRQLDSVKITSLSFSNCRKISNVKINTSESHEYWNEYEVIVVGFANGEVNIYEVVIDEGSWKLLLRKSLTFSERKGQSYKDDQITVVESIRKSHINYSGERVGKIEIVAGDVNGRVSVWRG